MKYVKCKYSDMNEFIENIKSKLIKYELCD